MKKLFVKPLKKLTWLAFFSVIVLACQDNDADKKISSDQAREQSQVTAGDNNEIVSATQETIEITSDVFANEGISDGRASIGGRISHHPKDDHGCSPSISGSFDIDKTHEDSLIYSGSLIIDYGDGSSCDSANVRKGKITDEFTYIVSWNDSITFSSVETITFEGFVKDSVQLDGTFIIRSSTGTPRTIEAQGAKITYPDGTSVSWEGTLSFTYEHRKSCKWKDNSITIGGSISGVNRDGAAFTWVITEDLVFKHKCDKKHRFHPISGTVEVTVGGILSTIDYGDGQCDKTYTITTNGETTEVTFEKNQE